MNDTISRRRPVVVAQTQSGMQPPTVDTSRVHFQLFSEADGQIRWRLLSANRRDLGRSVQSYTSAESARAAIDVLHARLHDAVGRARRAEPDGWTWVLAVDGVPVASTGRRFDRQIRCNQALALFLQLAQEATIAPAVLRSDARRGGAERVRLDPVVRPR